MKVEIKCVHCKAQNYIKKGFRKTQKRGKIQKFFCLECKRYFTNDEGFYKMKNAENIITMSVDMYLSNLSSRKMRNQLRRHLTTKISHVSVLDWVRRYVKKASKFIDNLQPKLSGKYYADETEIRRNKKDDVFWCCVDWDTRFIHSTLYSGRPQNMEDAKRFLSKIKATRQTRYIQTDAGVFYPTAFRKVFGQGKRKYNREVEHRINNVSKTKKHNVRIETVFSKIKDRVDDFRGLKALWSAPILMVGLIIQHNFIEQHTTVRDYPCERAGLNLNLFENRWLGLIRLAIS